MPPRASSAERFGHSSTRPQNHHRLGRPANERRRKGLYDARGQGQSGKVQEEEEWEGYASDFTLEDSAGKLTGTGRCLHCNQVAPANFKTQIC